MDLSQLPIIDQHAHNVLKPEAAAGLPLASAFTEAQDADLIRVHAPQTLCFRRSLRDLAELLDCEAAEDAIVARRNELGLEALTARCLQSARLAAVLLDDGFLPDKIQPVEWHNRFVTSRRILRLETLAEQLIACCRGFADFVEAFRASLDPPPADVMALKSIAAYRSGLAIEPVPPARAEERFLALKSNAAGPSPVRLTDKVLIDFLLFQALELANRQELPVQFHTGFGDPDLDLRLANPLHLRPILEDPRFARVPIVLLHLYPFVREGGYLAAVYPQVHADFGLAVPLLSVAGMKHTLRALLELTPTSKVLYSSDAHLIPELFYLGARWGRRVLGEVLEEAVYDGDLSAAEADGVAGDLLRDNARRLYRLED
jgi:predicted TIM-barrel fold metal-dependent hydrolase